MAFITRHEVNTVDTEAQMVFLRGLITTMVVNQPSTSHQLLCVRVTALCCLVFIIAVHLVSR